MSIGTLVAGIQTNLATWWQAMFTLKINNILTYLAKWQNRTALHPIMDSVSPTTRQRSFISFTCYHCHRWGWGHRLVGKPPSLVNNISKYLSSPAVAWTVPLKKSFQVCVGGKFWIMPREHHLWITGMLSLHTGHLTNLHCIFIYCPW